MEFMDHEFMGNTYSAYATFLALVVATIIATWIARRIVNRHLTLWSEKTATKLDDVVVKGVLAPASWLVVVIGVKIAKEGLTLAEGLTMWIDRLLSVASIAILFVAAHRVLNATTEALCQSYFERTEKGKSPAELILLEAAVKRVSRQIKEVGNMVIIIMAALTVLSNLGVDVKAIWASLGIGGIALVVAVKDPLTNIVGRVYIFSTGIFDQGHFIEFGEWSGTVKRIGVFRTSVELFSDMTTVTIPNADFVNKPVKNYFGRTKFMFKWDLDVPYNIPAERLEELVEQLKIYINSKPEAVKEATWVYLDRLDKHSKVVRVWFKAGLEDWATSLHYGSATLGEIQRIFARMEIDFAFPTQTLHLEPGEKTLKFAGPVEPEEG